jgi:cytoskeletal protein RodZ
VDERETLGSYLKNQRESKKISLKEVAKSTRVREHILRAIEEDQHGLLPPATYVKGFLIAYAKYLRLDPDDVLFRYEEVIKGKPVTLPKPQPPKPKQKIRPSHSPKSKEKIIWNTKQTWVVLGVLLVSFITFYFFSPFSSKPPIEPILKKPSEKPMVEEELPIVPSPTVTETLSVPEKKFISLQLKAIEETWVNLQVDDQSKKGMTFKPGDNISVQASNQIGMILGNAGGLELIFNGKPLEKLGKSGEVLTLIFTPQGVEIKRTEKPKPPKEETSNSKPQGENKTLSPLTP